MSVYDHATRRRERVEAESTEPRTYYEVEWFTHNLDGYEFVHRAEHEHPGTAKAHYEQLLDGDGLGPTERPDRANVHAWCVEYDPLRRTYKRSSLVIEEAAQMPDHVREVRRLLAENMKRRKP